MKSNKYKVRFMRFSNGDISVMLYTQRKQRPLFIWGNIDEEGLFNCKGAVTPSCTARQYLVSNNIHPTHVVGRDKELPGSITIDPSFIGVIDGIRQKSFYPEVGAYKRGEEYKDKLNPILLIEYIKKHGKFYGKQEKIFGRGEESAQNIVQKRTNLVKNEYYWKV